MYKEFKRTFECEDLGKVTKSPNDPKDYRVIKLQNGLTAMLISDKESCSEKKAEDNEDVKGGDKLAAAALCVGVGSFSDPEELPGLAHFLEHMVFMGSEKYPNENEFDEFVKKHGGMNNAYTDCENTVYYFSVEKSALQKGLDIFSGFFTKPLLKENSVDREIRAVDSEFSMSKPRDNPRLEQLYASVMAKHGHPMGKFTWGNLLSLKDNPAKNGIDLHARVKDFYLSSYSAQYMTLVVQAIYPLDTLETWVTDIFSAVPNIDKPRPDFGHLSEPFDTNNFNKLYKMVPCSSSQRLVISWSLPSLLSQYKSKPHQYLGFLVGHEGKGSIMAYLRRKMLATSMEAGNSEYGYEHNTTHSAFNINIQLTDAGFEQYEEVIGIVMEYMRMLRQEGPKEHLYQEIKTIEDNSFRWKEESDPIDNVESICPNMLRYPVEEYFTGAALYTKYDPQMIIECTNHLVPEKANFTLLSKKFSAEKCCNLHEPWYDTPYSVQDISADLLSKWNRTEPRVDLHLPEPNEFIASDFSLKDAVNHTEYPVALTDTPQSRLWFKQDQKFKVPKGQVSFLLISPLVKSSATSLCMFDMFLKIMEHQMTETAYAASVASLDYSLSRLEHGLTISVNGFNHKLLKLFKTIVDFIDGVSVDEDLLNTVKKQLEQEYYNRCIRPRTLNVELRNAVLRRDQKTLVECQQALPGITGDMVLKFVKDIFASVFVEGLIQGNITAQEAKEYEEYLLKKLNCQPIPDRKLPVDTILNVPEGELVIRTDNLNENDENSMTTNYYQHGPWDYRKYALNQLLMMRMEEPCFDILRTREQLGYSVHCRQSEFSGVLGFSIVVCSQAHKFDLDTVDNQIEKFLVEFEELLNKDKDEDFDTLRNSLITLKLAADANLGEEFERNWTEIYERLYHFDVMQRTVEEMKKATLQDMREWFKALVQSGGKQKKLSIQVEGHRDAAKDTKDSGDGDEENEEDDEEGEEEEEDDVEEEEQEEAQNVDSYIFQDLVLKSVDSKPETSVILDIPSVQQKYSFYPEGYSPDIKN